jgi:hypothetical protein
MIIWSRFIQLSLAMAAVGWGMGLLQFTFSMQVLGGALTFAGFMGMVGSFIEED